MGDVQSGTVTIECRCWFPLRQEPYVVHAEGATIPVEREKAGSAWRQVHSLSYVWLTGDKWAVQFQTNLFRPIILRNGHHTARGEVHWSEKTPRMNFCCNSNSCPGNITLLGHLRRWEFHDDHHALIATARRRGRAIVLTCEQRSSALIPLLICCLLYAQDPLAHSVTAGD